MMVALSSSETSVLTRATRRDIPEDDILHSHRRENLKPYTVLNCLKTVHDVTSCNKSNLSDLNLHLYGMQHTESTNSTLTAKCSWGVKTMQPYKLQWKCADREDSIT
jgi:hypothetical protein